MKPLLYKNKLLIFKGVLHNGVGKLIEYKNKLFTVVPWTASVYAMCAKFNIPCPSPLDTYDFSLSPYRPYKHQRVTTEFLLKHSRLFCWNEAGTGKTASCIWALDILRKWDAIKKVLIICPLSTTRNVWSYDLFKLITRTKHEVLVGTKIKRLKLLEEGLDIYVINHDGIKTLLKELIDWNPDVVIVDEHTAFKNRSSQRWKALNKVTAKAKRVWMLSGTPAPQSPLDLFAPARIVCPDLIGRSLARFRDLTMLQVAMYKWVTRRNFEDTVNKMVQPVIRFSRAECLDLPDVVYSNYTVDLSKQQNNAYKLLRRDAVLQINGGLITAVNEGVMRNKLLQCCSGYVYDTDKNVIDLKPASRIDALVALIQECRRGVIVFMSFRSSITAVHAVISKKFKTKIINGSTSLKQRTQYFSEFQEGKIKVLLAHPKTMGHGITLTQADTVIWYLVTSDNELYEQANSRIQRIGQENKMRVVHLLSTDLEKLILRRLSEKQSMQGVLLELLGKK